MFSRRLLVGYVLGFLLTGSVGRAADDASAKLAGTWWNKAREGGHDQFWLVQREGDKWLVRGWYKRNGEETGTFVGEDVKFVDGTLSYVHKYVKKPSEKFVDNVPATLKIEGDGLRYNYASATTKGSRLLVRFEEEPKPVVKEAPKSQPTKKESRLIGRWAGAVEGFDQIWTIRCADGTWSVEATYSKGGVEVGSFAGIKIQARDGEMTFVRKYVRKPVSAWPDETAVLVKLDGDNLLYSYKSADVKGERLLRRLPEEAKTEPKPTTKQEVKIEQIAGAWETEYDGKRVIWQITVKDGKWTVSADYYSKSKNALVGSWVGIDPQVKDGKLLFTARYTKKIPGYSDGKSFVCSLRSEDVLEYHYSNTGEKETASMKRVKK